MTVDYKKKYLKYKSKYLQAKSNYIKNSNQKNKFIGGKTEIEKNFDELLSKNIMNNTSLNTYLTNSTKNNLLLIVYAHWCGHCVSFIKESGQQLINHEETNNIKFIDGTQLNADLKNKLEITGFPTILKINNTSTQTNIIKKEYIGNRSVNSLIQFLNEA